MSNGTKRIAGEFFREGLLVENMTTGVLYKLSTAYPDDFSATQVYPVPARTSVRRFPWTDGISFRPPSKALVRKASL